jgi:cytochrome c
MNDVADSDVTSRGGQGENAMRKIPTVMAVVCMATARAEAASPTRPAAFAKCAICHVTASGQAPTVGPNLFGVSQRKSGQLAGYNYSSAMKNAAIEWTAQNLATFITAPQRVVPGTKMGFGGLKDPAEVKDVVNYLTSLKDP